MRATCGEPRRVLGGCRARAPPATCAANAPCAPRRVQAVDAAAPPAAAGASLLPRGGRGAAAGVRCGATPEGGGRRDRAPDVPPPDVWDNALLGPIFQAAYVAVVVAAVFTLLLLAWPVVQEMASSFPKA